MLLINLGVVTIRSSEIRYEMKKYFIDFLIGWAIGLVCLIGGNLIISPFAGGWGMIGYEIIARYIPSLSDNLLLLGLPYVILGIVPFSVYVLLPWYRKLHGEINLRSLVKSLSSFSIGIYLSYLTLLLLLGLAFSQGSFVW